MAPTKTLGEETTIGTCTFALDADGFSPADAAIGFRIRGKLTLSNSYTTTGDTITAATVGLGRIRKMEIGGGSKTTDTAHAYLFDPVYDSSGVNVTAVQAFWSATATNPFTEVTSGTDLSAVSVDCTVSGD